MLDASHPGSRGTVPTPAARLISDRPDLPPWAAEAAGEIDLGQLAEGVVSACLTAVFGRYRRDDEFVLALRASVWQNLSAIRQLLTGTAGLGTSPRDHVHAFATVQAKLVIPQTLLQRSYRVAFFQIWSAWSARLDAAAKRLNVERDDALAAQCDLSVLIFAYQDQVASEVADIYASDYDLLSQSRGHLRQRIVRDLLAEATQAIPPSDAAILGYPLQANHVAIILPSTKEADCGSIREALRKQLPGIQTLVQPRSLQSVTMWAGYPRAWSQKQQGKLVEALQGASVMASFSRAHQGMEGFRQAYREAIAVESVREGWQDNDAPRLLSYENVALEILLLRDVPAAAGFVAAELGPLSEPTPEAERLRQTLALWLDLNSHVSTAEKLGVHEHTVRNRLKRIDDLLGQPWQTRRTELRVALRLLRMVRREQG
ncbi:MULTISPECIES: CdaR family transcriptional regulator [unclassified Arthrobacter]|uniref:PucR family transcriptional regulator n=1 Tax=unclassified Arthrobacter TaxID=235627 RepID=UPI001C853B05|nr:helix-turn-helix domain-containing protein [Arthrobacter sp. MAHUQ-56]MBX7444615.1 helix-turn-helix domain-containing protein [Arthrobacter sp. MAHUQ-56]